MKKTQASFIPVSRYLLGIMFMAFVVLFVYSSLNLKNIDFGYRLQELKQREKILNDELGRLRAEKSSLLKLERVERIVRNRLGYQYPAPEQLIKVFED